MVDTSFPEVKNQLSSFVIVEEQVVHQQLHLFRVCCFIVIVDQAYNSSVVCIFNDGVMPGDTVVGEQGVQEWAEYTAQWDTSVQGECGGCAVTHPDRLESASE